MQAVQLGPVRDGLPGIRSAGVICTNVNPNLKVPFTVHDCSAFSDKHRPTWEQMDKLAIEFSPLRVSAPTRGFATVTTIQPVRVDEDEDEAARTKIYR